MIKIKNNYFLISRTLTTKLKKINIWLEKNKR